MNQCPICGDDQPKSVYCQATLSANSVFDLTACQNCQVVYFNPLPSPSQLEQFYSADYYDFNQHQQEGKGRAFARRLRTWRHSGRLLDIGCATGYFINGIRQEQPGWEVFGVEFSRSAAHFAQTRLGLDVRPGELAQAGFPNAFFDYLHLNNVLEHVVDPVGLLRECRRIIKPDGLFMLSVPNGYLDSLELVNFYKAEKKPPCSKDGHIFFFPISTLLTLISQSGFQILKRQTYSLKRGLRVLGWLPKPGNWKAAYFPRIPQSAAQPRADIHPAAGRKYPELYYQFRFWQGNLKMIPGLHNVGLDFLFLLQPQNNQDAPSKNAGT